MAVNFVKFERGSSAIYNRKKENHSLDENTLYFVYDNINQPEDGGQLYLGYRLISGDNSALSFSELSDVDVTSPSNGALLWYNNVTEKWEPATAEMLVASDVGEALHTNVSVVPAQEGKTKEQLLTTIEDKAEGNIAIVAGSPYVYDGSNWQPLVDEELKSTVTNLDTRVQSLETSVSNIDTQIQQAIEEANHLVYQVVPGGLPEALQAKENTIYLVPNTIGAESDGYSEYLYVNGSGFERLGTINDVSLEGYATTEYVDTKIQEVNGAISAIDFSPYALKTEVGNIDVLNEKTGNTGFTLAQEVEELYDRLQWQELNEN